MKLIAKNNTRKLNIINNISQNLGLPHTYGLKLIDDLISILISNVITVKQLKIKNFGTFSLKKKKKKKGRNPKKKNIYKKLERKK